MHPAKAPTPSRASAIIRNSLLSASFLATLPAVHAAEPAPAPSPWTELSLTVKETYDSNIFGTSSHAPLATLPEVANVSSWITTISPKANVNLRPWLGLGKESDITVLGVSYAGDYAFYHERSTETNQRHNFAQQFKLNEGATAFSLDNSLIYVDGRSATTQYGNTSCYGTAAARERKDQYQDRAKLVLRYDDNNWFVRGAGSILYYDLHTQQHQATGIYAGWQNYVDRYDVNVGGDGGYKLNKDLSLWLGYRAGEQKQANFAWDRRHNNSDYNRVLLGLEGKLTSWLKVDAQIGPDFRTYTDFVHTGINGEKHTWLYSEANVTADITKEDSLVFTSKVWHWVSSTGLTAYRDSSYILTYSHKFDSALSGNFGLKVLGSDYDAPATRKDWLYASTIGVKYSFSPKTSLAADYTYAKSHNRLSDVTYPGRETSQNQINLAYRIAY